MPNKISLVKKKKFWKYSNLIFKIFVKIFGKFLAIKKKSNGNLSTNLGIQNKTWHGFYH